MGLRSRCIWKLWTVDEYLPQYDDLHISNEWVGLRTVTPDDRPVVGETSVDGFHLATRMGGNGVTLAPAVGEFVSEEILGNIAPTHLNWLSPNRFAERKRPVKFRSNPLQERIRREHENTLRETTGGLHMY